MKPEAVERYVLKQLKKLMHRHQTKKTTLGEVLSDRHNEEPQQKFLRAQRFLNGQGSVKVEKIVRLAQFYDQSVTYFFPPELVNPHTLGTKDWAASHQHKQGLAEIEQGLRTLGFEEDFVKSHIRQLQALLSYKKN